MFIRCLMEQVGRRQAIVRAQRRTREAGANVIEAALVLPLLLLILGGVVDLGRSYHTYIVMLNAAREGARYAVTSPGDTSGIQAKVMIEASDSGVDLSTAVITVNNQGQGNPVRVTVQFDFPLLMGGIIGYPTISLQTSAAFRVF